MVGEYMDNGRIIAERVRGLVIERITVAEMDTPLPVNGSELGLTCCTALWRSTDGGRLFYGIPVRYFASIVEAEAFTFNDITAEDRRKLEGASAAIERRKVL